MNLAYSNSRITPVFLVFINNFKASLLYILALLLGWSLEAFREPVA